MQPNLSQSSLKLILFNAFQTNFLQRILVPIPAPLHEENLSETATAQGTALIVAGLQRSARWDLFLRPLLLGSFLQAAAKELRTKSLDSDGLHEIASSAGSQQLCQQCLVRGALAE
jgi:hypothetical protein